MNFTSGDASGSQLNPETPKSRPPRDTGPDGTIRYMIGTDSNIEIDLTDVNHKYSIPADKEDELAAHIFNYEKARASLEKAYGRWRTTRGKNKYEAEYMLMDEELELFSLTGFVNSYELATTTLREFLCDHETRNRKRVPPWKEEVKKISE